MDCRFSRNWSGFGSSDWLDLVLRTDWIWFLRTNWIGFFGLIGLWFFGLTGFWFFGLTGFWFFGLTGFGFFGLIGLWFFGLIGLWFFGLTGFGLFGLTGFGFFGLTGFWFFGSYWIFWFFTRIFLNIIMMTQRLALKKQDYNFFDYRKHFFDFWNNCVDKRFRWYWSAEFDLLMGIYSFVVLTWFAVNKMVKKRCGNNHKQKKLLRWVQLSKSF